LGNGVGVSFGKKVLSGRMDNLKEKGRQSRYQGMEEFKDK